jgi:alkylation response protein AidB-like acyl-CoA dehydrogenase
MTMDFELSDEQKMLAGAAQRYVREECSLEARRSASATADGFSRGHWQRFAEMGWLALPIPEDAGGIGGSDADVAVLMEQLGEGLVAEPYVDTVILCGSLIARSRNAALRATLLEGIAAGETIVILAHIEDDGRSEYETAVKASATRSGDGWNLSGSKQRVVHGQSADYWLVSAQTDGGIGLFAVASDTRGVSVASYQLIDGTRGADITFSETRLGADALLLPPGETQAALEEALDRAILATTAAAIGSMEVVMAITADYIKTRVQYGKPLSTFQVLQHRISEMFVETDQAHSILYRALSVAESGDAGQLQRAVSAAKTLVARSGHFVTAQGIQLHGGIGVTDEYVIGHHYKAMLVYEKRFGDASFHLMRSA